MNIQTMRCPVCGAGSFLTVDDNAYDKWLGGAYVQDAFPELSDGQRELLLTGIHPACWDTTFPPESDVA